MLRGKVMIIRLIGGQIKRNSIKLSQYFHKLHEHYSGNVKVELDLSHFVMKGDKKGATGVDTSNLVAKSDLATLKAEVDKIVIDKLKAVLLI